MKCKNNVCEIDEQKLTAVQEIASTKASSFLQF